MFFSINCDNIYILNLLLFFKILLFILFIILPITYSVLLYVTGVKNKRKSMKRDKYKRKILYCLGFIVFYICVVTIINIFSFNSGNSYLVCLNSANIEYMRELNIFNNEKEQVLDKQSKLSNDLNSTYDDNYVSGAFLDGVENNGVIKVLMIGNSLTYTNGYGEILTNMARATGRKIVVVNAVRGGRSGQAYNLVRNKLNYNCWSANTNSCSNQSGSSKLESIINIDFASQGRNSWDYIIVQNYIPSKSSGGKKYSKSKKISILKGSDMSIYNTVKNNLVSNSGFVIHLNRQSKFRSNHVSVLSNFGGSLVDTWSIIKNYPKYNKTLLLGDSARHQSVRGAYLYACVIYSKIYGKDNLASNINSNSFIEVYGSSTLSNYHPKPKSKRTPVSEVLAKKIQSHVYGYYDKYVLYY